jgi:two-component system, OmpR family, sensor histidine kinase VicK
MSISTFIIKGRKRALKEAYNRSLYANRSYYSITGDELLKSYKPFIRSLQDQIFRRGGSSYILTNIEKETIPAIKDLTEAGAEIKHIDISTLRRSVIYDDTVAYFSIVEPVITQSATESVEQTEGDDLWVGSTEPSVVQSAKKHFLSDWKTAVPATERIREIEEGVIHYDTRIIKDSQQIIEETKRLVAGSNELYSCLTTGEIQYCYNNFFEAKAKLLERQKKGEHIGIKAITIIDESNMKLAKIILDVGIQIRHVRNLPPVSFTLSDKEIAVTIEKMEAGKLAQSVLLSNEPAYISHFLSIFEELWKNGINAVDRIKDIEAGADLADIEVIQSSSRAKELYLDLINSAAKEILLVFPTAAGLVRQQKIGIVQLCQAVKERNVSIRILTPVHESTAQIVQDLRNYSGHIDVRYIEQTSSTKAKILLVDRKFSLVMELKDDSKETFEEAIGLSTYSNSRPGVLSYVSIFENLWTQAELYKQVKEANERLILHDKMQQEFINVAAHELRTPIQPILSVVGLIRSSNRALIRKDELDDSINIIARNATRLKQLSEDILDVTKIESQSLNLRKEVCILNDIVLSAIEEYNSQKGIRFKNNVQIEYTSYDDKIFVEVDKNRIAQVISNLLSNAFKFTKEGSILVITELDQRNKEATVSVKDSGKGIDPEVFPRLFEKFTSKSFQGTGLGLFISRSIVEGHGGRIWAVNNNKVVFDERGATFFFTLPIINYQPSNRLNQDEVKGNSQ